MAERQCGELFAPASEECIGADHERACSQLDQGCEDRIEVAFGARMQDMELQPEGAGRRLQVSRLGLGNSGIGRVDEQGNDGRRGDQLVQQFQPLRPYLHVQDGHAREVAARSVQAGDKSEPRPGRPPIAKTIGIVVVAAFAASAAGVPLSATITVTWRRTRSAAIAGSRSYWPSAQRYSIATLWPST